MTKPTYAPCEISLEFADGEYTFKLGLVQIAELQEQCKAGLGAIVRRVFTGDWYIEDLYHTARLGLIGGGVVPSVAKTLAERYVEDRPKDEAHAVAMAVLAACVKGYNPPEEKRKDQASGKKEAGPRRRTSTSPQPTATAP